MCKGETTLSCFFKNCKLNCEWAFTGAYCRGNNEEREIFERELEGNKRKWGDLWILGGDFNIILNCGDRNSNNVRMAYANQFREFVDRLELVDLPLS